MSSKALNKPLFRRVVKARSKSKTKSKEAKKQAKSIAPKLKNEYYDKGAILSNSLKKNIKNKIDEYDIINKQRPKTEKGKKEKVKKLDKVEKKLKNDYDIINKLDVKNKSVKELGHKINSYKEIKEITREQEIFDKLHDVLQIYSQRGLIYQQSIYSGHLASGVTNYTIVATDRDVAYVNDNYKDILERQHRTMYRQTNITSAAIQIMYGMNIGGKIEIRYISPAVSFDEDDDPRIGYQVGTPESNIEYIFLGFKISFATYRNKEISKKDLKELKAYYPVSCRKYHELTEASTTDNQICIYESFLHVMMRINLKHMRRSQEKKDSLRQMLKDEGEDIEQAVTNGKLLESLELLTKKYSCEITIIFFGTNDKPISVKNGISEELDKFNPNEDSKIFLYYKNVHVAPTIKGILMDNFDNVNLGINETNCNKDFKKLKNKIYKLNVLRLKGSKKGKLITNVLGFDCETYRTKDYRSIVFCITIYGYLYGKEIKKIFYKDNSNDCVQEFIDYLSSISTEKNNKITKTKEKIENIYVYGFNNSNFDNIFIYDKLYEEQPMTHIIFKNNSIKLIEFNNIRIMDLKLYYLGDLEKVAESFQLDFKKTAYPYRFPNEDNLNYIGELPDKEYFKDEDSYIKFLEAFDDKEFDMKKITTTYCMNDSRLVYEIAKKHLEFSVFEVERKDGSKRIVDIQECPTSSTAAIRIIQYAFLDQSLSQSPDKIILNERDAYKGGYCNLFKRQFIAKKNERMHAYDLCASYLSSMRNDMPIKYIKTMLIKETKLLTLDDINDTDNYLAKVKYTGNDAYYIPNILTRDSKSKCINGFIESDYSYHWGIELIEAINSGCEVRAKQRDIYETSSIFKEFAEYMYSKRLEAKRNGNLALSKYYKDIGNSASGKFGQKSRIRKQIVNNSNEMYDIINKENGYDLDFDTLGDNKIIFNYKSDLDKNNNTGNLVRFISYIAACSRTLLFKAIRSIGYEHIYYCDTDSIFTTKKLSKKFITETEELGKWKIEKDNIIEALFIAPKTYFCKTDNDNNNFSNICKAKGLDPKRLTEDDYNKLYEGHTIEQKRDMFFKSIDTVKIMEKARNIKSITDKRIWNDNNSSPFNNINDWLNTKQLDSKNNNEIINKQFN